MTYREEKANETVNDYTDTFLRLKGDNAQRQTIMQWIKM